MLIKTVKNAEKSAYSYFTKKGVHVLTFMIKHDWLFNYSIFFEGIEIGVNARNVLVVPVFEF